MLALLTAEAVVLGALDLLIALLRDIPRTATVIAHSAATVYELHRDLFLTAVLRHARTQRQADRIANARLAAGGAPGNGQHQGPDTPEPG